MKNNPILLEKLSIEAELKKLNFQQDFTLHCLNEVNSTNQYLLDLPASDIIQYCIAEQQSKGRGRLGRQWYSPFAENIYFSGRWPWTKQLSDLSGLSLVIGLAIVDTLQAYTLNQVMGLKWPNDILWHQHKLGGILIEIQQDSDHNTHVVIGIGLNINSSQKDHAPINKPWCTLYDIIGGTTDRNQLIAQLIVHVNQYFQEFTINGFKPFQAQWAKFDCQKDQLITIQHARSEQRGIARGVDDKGQLRLEVNQQIISITSGEID